MRPFSRLLPLLGAVLCASAALAMVEVGIDDQRISAVGPDGDETRDASAPAVVYNPDQDRYLVCWDGDHAQDGELEISCNVLTSAGGDLIPGGTQVSFFGPAGDAAYDAAAPTLAYNSTDDEYLVCWSGDTNVGGLVNDDLEIWCRRLDPNLTSVGSAFRVSEMGGDGDSADAAITPAVAWNFRSNNYLVCWAGDQNIIFVAADGEFEIYCRLLDADGSPLTSQFRVSVSGGFDDASFDALGPRVIYGSTVLTSNEYLVCWDADDDTGGQVEGESEVFCHRVSGTDGSLVGSQTRISAQAGLGSATFDATDAAVAFDPFRSRYLICWEGDDTVTGDGVIEIFCGEWDRNLTPTQPPRRVSFLGDIPSNRDAFDPVAIWGDELWGVCWQADRLFDGATDIDCQLLDGASLARRGPSPEGVSSMGDLFFDTLWQAQAPAIARSSATGEWLVVWTGDDDRPGLVDDEVEVYGQRIDPLQIFVDGFETGDAGRWSDEVP
jgi:hypothetical protein